MITLCERLAGQDANVTTVPVSILRLTRQLTRFFEWTNDVADRLAFSEVTTPTICSFFLCFFSLHYIRLLLSVVVNCFKLMGNIHTYIHAMQVLSSDTVFSVPMADTYDLLGVDSKDVISLEKYLQDYFTNILKKLKDLKAQSKQTDIFF